ncbi:hypothetical protein BY458DRAFT_456285 [Sporodiniella umbellata]|nr:hypothetical protein BY458DRAFT_456285 [Sporodiniella umbellata]
MDLFNQTSSHASSHGSHLQMPCMLSPDIPTFEPNADDILVDEDLLDLFRIIKTLIRKRPGPEDMAKLLFCVCYALYEHIKFSKPVHEDRIVFCDIPTAEAYCVKLSANTSCCQESPSFPRWFDPPLNAIHSPGYNLLIQTPYRPFRTPQPTDFEPLPSTPTSTPPITTATTTVNSTSLISTPPIMTRPPSELMPYSLPVQTLSNTPSPSLLEPNQRGFYYHGDRIGREPAMLQRYAEHGVLSQASLIRKRKRHSSDSTQELGSMKKAKIPHRHGEFESRRDDIIHRLRTVSFAELEQKASKLPENFSLAIERTYIPTADLFLSEEQRAKLLEPSLKVLTAHSNKKPHLDNGMNQNGIYYNTDYFQLYLAFEQFQKTFAILYPNDIVPITQEDKDRDRNQNMKSYRPWIEPRLMDSNWPAFRRNIVVGERMMQLTNTIGQGMLLITKELSGSKLHLTFTNSEWDEFITGLNSSRWDTTIDWSKVPDLDYLRCRQPPAGSLLVTELQEKFASHYWFTPDYSLVPSINRAHLYKGVQNCMAAFSKEKHKKLLNS